MINEEVFRYGESNRGFGMMTMPENAQAAPVVVLFNAGLTYREGPYRLNVLLARELAKAGYIAVRVDLSGKGDTPERQGLTNRESVAKDWDHIKERIKTRYPDSKLLLMGLCSGADNAIKIAAESPAIKGLILLDPVVPADREYYKRVVIDGISNPYNWIRSPKILLRYVEKIFRKILKKTNDEIDLRDLPTLDETSQAFKNLVSLNGRVLSVFTHSAAKYYNKQGQMVMSLEIDGLSELAEEEYWPWMRHLYVAQLHRDDLVARVKEWAVKHRKAFID